MPGFWGRRRLHPDPGAYLLVGCADRRRHWHRPVPSDNHRFGGGLRLRFGRTGGPAYGGFDAGRRFHWLPIWGWRHPVRRTIQDPLPLWDSGAFRRRFRGARTGFASDTGSGRAALDGGDGSPIGGWRGNVPVPGSPILPGQAAAKLDDPKRVVEDFAHKLIPGFGVVQNPDSKKSRATCISLRRRRISGVTTPKTAKFLDRTGVSSKLF